MIKQIFFEDEFEFDSLINDCYLRNLKSNYNAYGAEYDFCRFFKLTNNYAKAIIGIYYSAMIVVLAENLEIDDEFIDDLVMFIRMSKPDRVEVDNSVSEVIKSILSDEYSVANRTELFYNGKLEESNIEVNESPKLDDVFKIVKEAFPSLRDTYEVWITDTSHRIRHSQSNLCTYQNASTLMVKYYIDGYALIGQIGTLISERGKNYARELIYYVCKELIDKRFKPCLFARDNMVSYYTELGFTITLNDFVLERKK